MGALITVLVLAAFSSLGASVISLLVYLLFRRFVNNYHRIKRTVLECQTVRDVCQLYIDLSRPRAAPTEERTLKALFTNMFSWVKSNPLRTCFRIFPAIWALRRATKRGSKVDAGIAISSLVSFVLDFAPGDDKQLVSDMSEIIMRRAESVRNLYSSVLSRSRPTFQNDSTHTALKLFAFALSVLGGASIATEKGFMRFSKVLNDATKNLKNLDTLRDQFGSFFGLSEDENEIRDIITQSNDVIMNFRTSSFNEKVKNVDDIKQILQDTQKVAERAERNPVLRGSSLLRNLIRQMQLLEDLQANLKIALDHRASIRPHPVCRNFIGAPGAGKTTLIREGIIPRILEQLGDNTPAEEVTYSLDRSSQHFPGYMNQRFFIVDEFLDKQHDDPFIQSFNALATDQATLINGAAIEFKNMRPRHEFLFTISNTNQLQRAPNQAAIAHHVDAFNDRLENVYVHFPEYDPAQGRHNQPAERVLCMHEVPTSFTIPKEGNRYLHHICPGGVDGRQVPHDARRQRMDNIIQRIMQQHAHFHNRYLERVNLYDVARDRSEHQSAGDPLYVLCTTDQEERILEFLTTALPSYTLADWEHGRVIRIARSIIDVPDGANLLNVPINLDFTDAKQMEGLIKQLQDCEVRPAEFIPPEVHCGAFQVPKIYLQYDDADDAVLQISKRAALTPEEKRMIRSSFSSTRRSVQMAYVDLLRRIYKVEECTIYFPNYVRYSRHTGKDMFSFSNAAASAYFLTCGGKDKQQEFVVNLYYNSSRSDLHAASAALTNFGIVVETLSLIVWTYLLYSVGSSVVKFFTSSSKEEEEEDIDQHADPLLSGEGLHDPRFIATLLQTYKLSDDGKMIAHFEKGDWVYDEDAGRWVRVSSLSGAKLKRLQALKNHDKAMDYAEYNDAMRSADHESADAGLRPKRHYPGGQTQFQTGPLDNIIMTTQPQGGKLEQEFIDAVVQDQLSDRAEIDTVVDVLSKARVTVMSNDSSQYGVAMKGNFVLTNSHFTEDNHAKVLKDGVSYRAVVFHRDRRRDLLLLRVVERSWPAARDLTNFLADGRNITYETSAGLVLPGKHRSHVHYGYLVWDLQGATGGCGLFDTDIAKIHWPSKMTLTRRGECGSAMILNSTKRNVALFAGIHSFAVADVNISGCAIITRQMFESMFAHHEMELHGITTTEFHGRKVAKEVAEIFTHPNPKARDPFPPNDRLHFKGHFHKAVIQQTMTSEYHPVPFPINNPPRKVPAVMPNRDLPNQVMEKLHRNPFGQKSRSYTQMAKMVIQEKKLGKHRKLIVDGLTQHYLDLVEPGEVRVLTNFEVVNGVKAGPLSQVNGFDMATSPGFTLKKLFDIKKKGDLFNFNGVYVPNESPASRYLYSYIVSLENGGDVLMFPSQATLKDEVLPTKKVQEDGKVRLFSNNDMLQLFADKKYFGWCMGFAHNHLLETHQTVGINPAHSFHEMYEILARKGNFFTGDYSAWDKTLPLDVMEAACDVLRNVVAAHYESNDYRVADALLQNMCERFEVLEGSLFYIKGSMSSGIWLTNFLNSLCNIIVQIWTVMEEADELGRPVPHVPDVLLHCAAFMHGDDKICASDDEFKDVANYFTAKKHCAKIGLKMTPASKDARETAFEEMDETSFLSRFPKKIGNRIVGALKHESIEQQLEHQRSMDMDERCQLMDSLLLESVPWGEEYFTRIRDSVIKNMKAWKTPVDRVPTYDMCKARLLEVTGQARCAAPSKATFQNKFSDPTSAHTELSKMPVRILLNCSECDYTVTLTRQTLAKCKCKGRKTLFEGNTLDPQSITQACAASNVGCWTHLQDTHQHRVDINTTAQAFFQRTFPDHDLSKFSDAERLGYQLFFFEGVGGDTWNFALWHHYSTNDHHPVHFRLNDWDEFSRGDKFNTKDPGRWETSLLQEVIADAVACMKRRHGDKTIYERLEMLRKEYTSDSPFTKDWPQSILPMLVGVIDDIPKVKSFSTVREWSDGSATFTNFTKFLAFMRNSKKMVKCPECEGHLPEHKPECVANHTYKCSSCTYTNDDGKKMANHITSAHPNQKKEWSLVPCEHQSGRNVVAADTTSMIPTITDSEHAGGGVLAMSGTVPPTVNLMPGYIADILSLSNEFVEISYHTVPSTTPRGTVINTFGYAEVESMPPAARVMAQYHKYFHGPIELEFTVFGSGNKVGSLLIGQIPNVTEPLNDITTVHSYGNWKSLAMNTQSVGTLTLMNTDNIMRPREILNKADDTTFRGGITMMIEEPVANAISADETEINIQVKARLAPAAGFTYPLLPEINSISNSVVPPGRSVTSTNLGTITGLGDGRLLLDGDYIVSSRIGKDTVFFPKLLDGDQIGKPRFGNLPPDYPAGLGVSSYEHLSQQLTGWVQGYAARDAVTLSSVMAESYTTQPPFPRADYIGNTVATTFAQPSATAQSGFVFSGGSSAEWLYLVADATGITPGNNLNNMNLTSSSRTILSFTERLGFPTKRTVRPGLKRFTLGERGILFTVNQDVTTAFPVFGESYSELALREWLSSNYGEGNLIFSLEDNGYPLGEFLYDADDRTFWVFNSLNYGYIDTDFNKVEIVNVSKVSKATNPRAANVRFTTLVRSNTVMRAEFQASAAIVASAFAQGSSSFMGNLMNSIGSGVSGRKNREFIAEQAELSRAFISDQNAKSRKFAIGMTAFETKLEKGLIGYKTDLAMDVANELYGLRNFNMATTNNAAVTNSGYKTVAPTPELSKNTTGGSSVNKNQNFVDAGDEVTGIGRSLLDKGAETGKNKMISGKPGVGAPGAMKPYVLPKGGDYNPPPVKTNPNVIQTGSAKGFVSGGIMQGSASTTPEASPISDKGEQNSGNPSNLKSGVGNARPSPFPGLGVPTAQISGPRDAPFPEAVNNTSSGGTSIGDAKQDEMAKNQDTVTITADVHAPDSKETFV